MINSKSKLESTIGWEVLNQLNILIGKKLNFEPKISFSVCSVAENACCYSPERIGFSTPEAQKDECDRWLSEHSDKYPESWVVKNSYKTTKEESYPIFHKDWEAIIEAIKTVNTNGYFFPISTDIEINWSYIYEYCTSRNLQNLPFGKIASENELVTKNVDLIAKLLPRLSNEDQHRFFLLLGIRLDTIGDYKGISTKKVAKMYELRCDGVEWSRITEKYITSQF